jgi:hypothetical protein
VHTTPLADVTTYARPEVQVLLCCAQTCHNLASTTQLPHLLRHDLDWTSLIRLALRHRVLPLVYRGLQTFSADLIPPAIHAQLHHHYHANAQRNLLLAGTLLKLLRVLETHRIPAIPYKGPVLALAAYGNLALRQFGDLDLPDLLVRKQDAERATDLLLTQGYRWWAQRPRTLFPHQRKVSELVKNRQPPSVVSSAPQRAKCRRNLRPTMPSTPGGNRREEISAMMAINVR